MSNVSGKTSEKKKNIHVLYLMQADQIIFKTNSCKCLLKAPDL
jgi:hypothetical protein